MDTRAQNRALRRVTEGFMPDRATIYRRTVVPDGTGGQDEQWTVLAADVPCRIAPIAGGEVMGVVGGRISDESTHIVAFPSGQDVDEPDVIAVDGVAYEATLVRTRGEMEVDRRVEVKESPDGIPEVAP